MDNNTSIQEYNEDTKIADAKDYDVYLADEYVRKDDIIPGLSDPDSNDVLQFAQTKATLLDSDNYRQFLASSIRAFRRSRMYKGYKSYLISLGMDRCQILSNITEDMAVIEMHHNILTIYDIALMITEHVLNTVGHITSFDLIALLVQEHRLNNIPIVMLSKTAHQLYHDNPDFYIPISMTFGQWWVLLVKYRYGITYDIALKVAKYITKCQKNNELKDIWTFQFQNDMMNWGRYNEYNRTYIANNYSVGFNGGYIDESNLPDKNIQYKEIATGAREE